MRVKKRIMEWERKFGQVQSSSNIESGWIESPISRTKVEFMTDEQWLKAIEKYKTLKDKHPDDLKGGARELSRELEVQAHKHGQRFAKLVLHLPQDCYHGYYDAIIRGITKKETYKFDKKQDKIPPSESASFEDICSVIRYVSTLKGNPCAKEICEGVARLADYNWPEDILKYIVNCAVDPNNSIDNIIVEKSCEDIYINGINTVPGVAAITIARLLSENDNRFKIFKPAILHLINHHSAAVRSCAAACCSAMLKIDRDKALEYFLKLTDINDERLLATPKVKEFLYSAYHTHYNELKKIIKTMVKSRESKVAEIGTIVQIRSWLEYGKGEELTQICLNGSKTNRLELAKLFAKNYFEKKYFERVKEYLKNLFNDPSKEVRNAALQVFGKFGGSEVDQLKEILSICLKSPVFWDNPSVVLQALERCYSVDKISKEIFLLSDLMSTELTKNSRYLEKSLFLDVSVMIKLVLRLYDQGSYCSEIRSKCLDVIDQMLKARIGEVINELKDIER
ncbi:hypothetical protein [Anoxybacter fermentans]|nr:hypothetical protein [Anoxybacter fermentans]